MRNLVSTYVDQFRQDRQKQIKLAAVLAALAVVVAGVVFWQLHNTGVAMTNEVFCGQEEHVHDDGCYEQVLICDNEEADHVHDDGCYETVLTCQIPEHVHTVECLMDDTADVETADVWEATLPSLSGNWSEDVAAIAESQLGYTESTANFVLADDGETHMGYTRYGAWYGNAYGDWDAMFASFCLNYANVPASVVAESSGAYALAASLDQTGLYIDSADFTPAAGDLVFFDENGNGQADRVGIIVNAGDNELTVIEGNSEDAVAENTYDINDSGILAFGILPDQGTPDGTENIDGDLVYVADDGGVYVSVTAPADALPEGAELSVTLIDEDSTGYAEAADAIGLNVQTLSTDEEETGMAVLDICFLLDGEEVEPAEPVTVSIDAGAILPEDAENIAIQHLEETTAGVVPVLMAKLDAANPVAEFEVENFSSFTVTWENGRGIIGSITVTVYLDGEDGPDIEDITFTSENDELDLEDLLEELGLSGDYVLNYAIAYVGNTPYGTVDNPVIAIEILEEGGGPTATSYFELVYADGNSDNIPVGSALTLEVYYVTPDFSVTIQADDTDENEDWLLEAVLSHPGDYVSASYEWTITDTDGNATEKAVVQWQDGVGNAFIVWQTGVVEDNDQFIVSVTVTLTLEDGLTKTATAEYYLEYGDETVDLIMTYGPNKTALPAGVTVTLTSGSGETYIGTTESDGWVHDLDIEPGIYTVTATYTDSDGNIYQCSETVDLHVSGGNYSINLNYYNPDILTSVTNRDNWEHIDIKLSVGTSASDTSSESVSVNIIGVVIYENFGEENQSTKYTATEDSIESNDNEFQCSFYEGDGTSGGEATHSISFSTSDTIAITYTLTWTRDDGYTREETYTIYIDASTVYDAGTTYPATGQRAYKLYNYLYGTEYISDAQLLADGIEEIDIGGMSMMLVASILCDSSDVTGAGTVVAAQENQWGMDFAVSIDTFIQLSTNWRFDIEKTYENHAMNAGDFTFYLWAANFENGDWSLENLEEGGWYLEYSNGTQGRGIDGNSSDTIEGIYITFDDDAVRAAKTHYYIIFEEEGDAQYTTYDGTVFGAAVYVGIDEETGEAVVETTYYILTANGDGTYSGEEYTGDKITYGNIGEDDEYPIFHFVNTYQTGVQFQKVDVDGNILTGAQFTLTQAVTDPDTGETVYYYFDPYSDSYDENDPDSGWVEYDPNDPSVEFTVFEMGSISLGTPYDGLYTLTEVGAPAGYEMLPGAIVIKIENGLIVNVEWEDDSISEPINNYVSFDDAGINLYVEDENTEFDFSIFKYTGDVIWTSEVEAGGGSPTDIDNYYLRYTDADGSYWYALVGTGTGEIDDPFVVTGWTENQDNAWSTSVYATEGGQYYFTGKIGSYSVFFESEDPPTGEVDDSITLVEGTYQALAGAEFILQDSSSDQYAVLENNGNGTYTLTGWTSDPEDATIVTSGDDGYIYISGMTFGTYTLTETKAPDGYNMLTESVEFTIETDGEVDSQIVVGNSVGVVNTPGSQLPNTGGVGTWIYTVAGLLLIGGAASLLVYRKRRVV